jgi:argininosuccinate lyase
MPGFTHLQPAQPTTVAHYLCSYASALARDTERLFDAYERINRSPLGAAAFAGTPFDIDRDRTASLLGFDGIVENSMDAASTRDFLLETTGALTALSTTLSGIAEDLVVFSNAGYIELDDAYASTSSIMPQKKNPDTMELVRATAGDTAAGMNALSSILKGLPRAYNRDLQRAHPHAFEAIDAVTEATTVTAGALATAEWQTDALAAAAGEGFSTATGVADVLAMAGVPFRTAHEVVALAAERTEGQIEYADLDAAATEVLDGGLRAYTDREEITEALDPIESVRSRGSAGGPAPGAVEHTVEGLCEAIQTDSETLQTRRNALREAENALETEVSRRV